MANGYNQGSVPVGEAHFSASPLSQLEFSRMTATPRHITALNAGKLVPIYCQEVLPNEEIIFDIDAVIRQTTMLVPVMGQLYADFYAFFVPNRVVNQSWKETMGENSSGSWANIEDIQLAPLMSSQSTNDETVTIPVGSIADYYGFPTQKPMPIVELELMNDLKFRGYFEIYNEYFRGQNYQPPIPYSKLNVYEGFMNVNPQNVGGTGGDSYVIDSDVGISPNTGNDQGSDWDGPMGQYPDGAIYKAIYGEGASFSGASMSIAASPVTSRSVLVPPLKVNKLHDYFTSVLPSTQKGKSLSVMFPSGSLTLNGTAPQLHIAALSSFSNLGGDIEFIAGNASEGTYELLLSYSGSAGGVLQRNNSASGVGSSSNVESTNLGVKPFNVPVTVSAGELGSLDITQLRTAIAVQQVYELLARSGSLYREYVKSFFGVEVDDPYSDIPKYLGHVRRELKNYQVAQTSASQSGSTAQGNLTAYGYTATGGHMFREKFLEHGYVHVFCVIRHKNLYPAMLSRDNFRRTQLDFYNPILANLSEQPVYLREINPFGVNANENVFGYQEAWAEYRYEPDRVSGIMRPGVLSNVAIWNMADDFDDSLQVADGAFMQSNSQEVVDRSLAVQVGEDSTTTFQFYALFTFTVDKTLPMPTYSVPGLDIV